MGTAKLNPAKHIWLQVLCLLSAGTLLVALLVAMAGPALHEQLHDLLGLRLNGTATPAPTLGRMLALAAHNLTVTAWPLLLGPAGADRSKSGRRLAGLLLTGSLTLNVVVVGGALGAYGPDLFAFLPQLPLEWAALALAASWWLAREQRARTVTCALRWLAVIAALVLCAAALETFAVPHSPTPRLEGWANTATTRLTRERL